MNSSDVFQSHLSIIFFIIAELLLGSNILIHGLDSSAFLAVALDCF